MIGSSSSTSPEPHISLPVFVAAAAPACLVTLGVIVFVLFELSGRTLSSEGLPHNVAEAAVLNNDSTVMRLLNAGEDPSRVVDVRPFVISSGVRRVSGLEAAVWGNSLELIAFFDRAGAIGDGERRRLSCLAADLRREDIVEYLAPNGAPECEAGRALAEVEARTPREP